MVRILDTCIALAHNCEFTVIHCGVSRYTAIPSDTLPYMTTLIRIDASTVPQILRATRGAAGLSARSIAPLIGVSHGTVSNWERGQAEPSVSQFLRWAEVTGQPAGELLNGVAA